MQENVNADNYPDPDFELPEGFREGGPLSRLGPETRQHKRWRKYAFRVRRRQEKQTWMKLRRRDRKDACARLSWKIQQQQGKDGLYWTHDILPGSRKWPDPEGEGVSLWADLHFLSRKRRHEGVLYNAVFDTVAKCAASQIVERCKQEVEAQLTEDELRWGGLRSFSRNLPGGGCEMRFAPRRRLAALGGLTVGGACAKWIRDRWDTLEDLVEVSSCASFDHDYQYGIGLHLVAPPEVSRIDARTLPGLVQAFLDRGEVEYRDPPANLRVCGADLRRILSVHLYQWDCEQAKSEGIARPKPDPALSAWFGYQSQAIDW